MPLITKDYAEKLRNHGIQVDVHEFPIAHWGFELNAQFTPILTSILKEASSKTTQNQKE